MITLDKLDLRKISISFDSNIDDEQEIKKNVKSSLRQSQKFFGLKTPNISIFFLYKREEMDKIACYKTARWVVGYAKKNNIYIFSPSVFDKVSDHPLTDFNYVLTHEIVHVFSNKYLNFVYPAWLNEGLAGYVAKQYEIKRVDYFTDLIKIYDFNDWNKNHNYPQAYSFTKFLIEKLGKEKLCKFLRTLKINTKKQRDVVEFSLYFDIIFHQPLEDLFNLWKKTINDKSYNHLNDL